MTRTLLLSSLMLTTVACASGKANLADDTGSSDITGGGSGGGGGGGDGETPWIEEADSWCYLHSTGDKAYFWVAELRADDPQGVDTLEDFQPDAVVVSDGDTEVARYALVCTDGECLSSWNESQDGVSCTNAESYTIAITVMDEDGNISDTTTVTGRQGTDAAGR